MIWVSVRRECFNCFGEAVGLTEVGIFNIAACSDCAASSRSNICYKLELVVEPELRYPSSLYYDESRGRLYVAEGDGPLCRVLVFNDVTNLGAAFNQ